MFKASILTKECKNRAWIFHISTCTLIYYCYTLLQSSWNMFSKIIGSITRSDILEQFRVFLCLWIIDSLLDSTENWLCPLFINCCCRKYYSSAQKGTASLKMIIRPRNKDKCWKNHNRQRWIDASVYNIG